MKKYTILLCLFIACITMLGCAKYDYINYSTQNTKGIIDKNYEINWYFNGTFKETHIPLIYISKKSASDYYLFIEIRDISLSIDNIDINYISIEKKNSKIKFTTPEIDYRDITSENNQKVRYILITTKLSDLELRENEILDFECSLNLLTEEKTILIKDTFKSWRQKGKTFIWNEYFDL